MSKIKKQEIGKKPRNTIKKTQEDVEDELLKLFPNYELKDKYINLRTPALFHCKKHNINFEGNLSSLLIQGKEQCPECIKENRSKFFRNYIRDNHPNIEIVGDYVSNKTPIKLKCKVCGKIFCKTPETILRKNRQGNRKKFICDSCKKLQFEDNRLQKFKKSVIKKFGDLFDLSNVYLEKKSAYNLICNKCKNQFYVRDIFEFLRKGECPICCKKTKSCGELYIENWFNKNKIHFQSQVRFSNDIIVGKFENSGVIIDFCFEYNSKKYWIEYNGEQHYVWCKHLQSLEKFEGQLRRDSNVRVYCKNNNIILIEIPWKYNSQIKVDDILDKIIFKQEPTSIIIQPEISYQREKRKEGQDGE